jgi:hypothetical protein
MAPHAEIHFERCAVLPSQIYTWDLPTRPTRQSDSRSKSFGAAGYAVLFAAMGALFADDEADA